MSYKQIPRTEQYITYEIREAQAPFLNIWPLMTTSYECSGDMLGRSRLLLLDTDSRRVMGLSHNGGTRTHHLITPLEKNTRETLEDLLPWENILNR